MNLQPTDSITLITGAARTIDVVASWHDEGPNHAFTETSATPSAITTATTTTIVAAPSASTSRVVEEISIRNKDSSSCLITVLWNRSGTAYEQYEYTIAAGGHILYADGVWSTDTPSAVGIPNLVILTSDVTNDDATPDTLADITGLSFTATAGYKYEIEARVYYTAAATTTGARFVLNGPGTETLYATSRYPLDATSETVNYVTAYQAPAAANVTSLTAGNVAVIKALLSDDTGGTIAVQFASEESSSAIVAKAGSTLVYTLVATS